MFYRVLVSLSLVGAASLALAISALPTGASGFAARSQEDQGKKQLTLESNGKRAKPPVNPSHAQLQSQEQAGTGGMHPKPDLVPQVGHPTEVLSLAFSPDGRYLASGSGDGTVKVWDVKTGLELHSRTAGARNVGVTFSPDGRLLASEICYEGLSLWEAPTGRLVKSIRPSMGDLQQFQQHVYSPRGAAVTFSPDSRWIATCALNKKAKLWEVATGREILVFSGHTAEIMTLAFSPDGRWLATGSQDHTVKLWDIGAGHEAYTLSGHTGGVNALAFSPEGKLLASGSSDKTIKLWDVATGLEIATLVGHTDMIASVAFSPDGRNLASGSIDKTLRLWDVRTARQTQTLPDYSGEVESLDSASGGLAFSPDGRTIAASSPGGITLWDVLHGRKDAILGQRIERIDAVAFSADGRTLFSAGDGVTSWDMSMGRRNLGVLGDNQSKLRFLQFSADKRLVAGVSPDRRLFADSSNSPGTTVVFDVDAGRAIRAFQGPSHPPYALAFSSDGRSLASAGPKNTVKLYDLSTGKEMFSMATGGFIASLAFSPDGHLLASSTWTQKERPLRLWDVQSGLEVRYLTLPSKSAPSLVAFSPDGRWLAVLDYAVGRILLYDIVTGGLAQSFAQEDVFSMAFSPRSSQLAIGGMRGTLSLWDVSTGRELGTMQGGTECVRSVAFSADGRWLASAGWDGTRLWDLTTGEVLATLFSAAMEERWLVVTPDGLFDGSEEGMQKLVAWRIGNRVYPPDRFFADYYTPGLLARIFAGERPKPHVDLASLRLPPDVRITSPATATTLKQDRVTVNVEAQDQGGGIAEVRLYQNGKLVGSKAGSRGPSARFSFDVELVPGENILKATALSRERVESNEDWVRVMLDVPELTKPTLYVMVVGINKYEDGSLDLHYARQDGEAIANFFQERGGRLFDSVKAVELFDGAASQARIEEALQQLAQEARPQDVVLYYLAGHGAGLGEQFYFLPHEMRRETDLEGAIRKYGISAFALGEALQRIRAQKQVLILDACEAETALPILAKAVMFRGLSGGEAKAMQMLARSKGVYLIAASKKEQYAGEVPQLGHGVLAYALLAALGEKGEPQAAATPEGIITMMSLLQYVNQQVPELTEKYEGGEKQYPVSTSTGMDFPLMVK